MPQLKVLMLLVQPWRDPTEDGGPDTVGSLARRLGLSPPTVTAILDRLSQFFRLRRETTLPG